MKKGGLISLTLCIGICVLFVGGCSAPPKMNKKVEAPSVWNGHRVLQPKEDSYKFNFINSSFKTMTPSHQGQNKKPYLIKPMIWSSTCSGELTYKWEGYQELEKAKMLCATFNYTLKDFKYSESTKFKDGHHWEEHYGNKGDIVTMKKNGKNIKKPMGEMVGDPRQYFISGVRNIAYLLPDGRPAYVEAGRWFNRSSYMKASQEIGQYFFKGIQVEALAHRLGVMLPFHNRPLDKEMKWNVPLMSQVLPEKAGQVDKENWTLVGKSSINGKEVLLLVCEAHQVLKRGRMRMTGELIQGWTFQRQGKAKVEVSSGIAFEVEIQENYTWVDFLPYRQNNKDTQAQMLIHRVTNHYKMNRS